jgi:UDP-N-acetyl-D-glucosamine dehydrogenase
VLTNAVQVVGKNLKRGCLVIVESTIEPGTCRTKLLPILIKESGLAENDFYLAYSPERIDPLNKNWGISNTPKLVSGITEDAVEKAVAFYAKFINSITRCSSVEIAETAKLLENSFRLINISFINELAIFCNKIGIDVNEVVSAAATKPYGFMPFYPSIGAGGHCIPVDPIYLASAAKAVGASTRFIDLADQINQEIPGYVVGRAVEKIGSLRNKKVIVVGVSYKPNVADVRQSPVVALISELKQKGAVVSWHDDLVNEWNGEKSVTLSGNFDLAIIATPHEYLDLTRLGNVPILNTRGSI